MNAYIRLLFIIWGGLITSCDTQEKQMAKSDMTVISFEQSLEQKRAMQLSDIADTDYR